MPTCKKCGTSSLFLLLTEDGLCRPCEITRQISLNEEFHISKVFHVFLPNNYIFYVAVDDKNKRFALCAQTMSKPIRIGFYDYTDLIEFEVSESEPVKNMCNAMMVNVYLNSLQRPHISFYVINSPVQFGSKQYYKAVRMAKQVYAVLRYLQHNAAVVLQERRSAETLRAVQGPALSMAAEEENALPGEPENIAADEAAAEANEEQSQDEETQQKPAAKHPAKKPAPRKTARKTTAKKRQPAQKPTAAKKEEPVVADDKANEKAEAGNDAKPEQAVKDKKPDGAKENSLLKSLKDAGGAAKGVFSKLKDKVTTAK